MIVIFDSILAINLGKDTYHVKRRSACDEGPLVFKIVSPSHRHKIAGTVTVDGQPARRNIVAVERGTLKYVGATTSDSVTGAWKITGLPEYPERSLLVFALDTTGNYNAEVADYISQVATV